MVDHELNELKREFLQEASAKVREIESTLDAARDSAKLDRLAYLAHQLKGSGGSYGYQLISTESAELEKAFERMAADGGDVEASVRAHVRALQQEIDLRLAEL